jgi:uncharacterized protein YggL (DUF469 family)
VTLTFPCWRAATSDFMRDREQMPIQERRNVIATKPRVRRLNRRQRKKLRVGEFQELIFEISVIFKTTLDAAARDFLIDDFCEHITSHGLGLCGFGGRLHLAATEGWIAKRGRVPLRVSAIDVDDARLWGLSLMMVDELARAVSLKVPAP